MKQILSLIFLLSLAQVLAGTYTMDLGLAASRSPASFQVELPEDFRLIEIAHYEESDPNTMAKYMGWNGYVKVNDQPVWNVKSTTPNGVFIFDRTIGKLVDATSGVGAWADATNFFRAGKNRLEFYHENQGKIGVKVRVTVVTEEEARQQQKENWGFGFEVKKSAGGRCESNSDCASGNCKRSACCEAGQDCCNYDGECPSGACSDRFYYCIGAQETKEEPDPKGTQGTKACDGCLLAGRCLPYRERLDVDGIAQYCAISGKWLLQIPNGGVCQNAYECVSNICSNDMCGRAPGEKETPNLLARLLNWLKNVFG